MFGLSGWNLVFLIAALGAFLNAYTWSAVAELKDGLDEMKDYALDDVRKLRNRIELLEVREEK